MGPSRVFSLLLAAVLFLAVPGIAPVGMQPVGAGRSAGDLLQFTAQGHVLGFAPDGFYLTNAAYALHVDFVGGLAVQPASDTHPEACGALAARPFSRVTYAGLWPGITLAYAASPGGLVRSTYTLAPGADVRDIRLRYNAPVTRERDGSLRVRFSTGEVWESAPVAWQDIGGQRVPVQVAFAVSTGSLPDQDLVGFALGPRNGAYPVWIDPLLTWNTFLGGAGSDYGRGMAADGDGNIYVAGYSSATWQGANPPVRSFQGTQDAFVAKLDSSGGLVWNTFLGGSGFDTGRGVAVDGDGNVYVSGDSNATWQGSSPPVRSYQGGYDAFVAKLSASGGLTWNTFLGSTGDDSGYGMAVSSGGSVYVTGDSIASWQGANPPVRAFQGGHDAFAARLDSSGGLTWNTFLGSTAGWDYGWAIAVDGSGDAYVAGYSNATWGSPVRNFSGAYDGYAAKLDSSGGLTWNTFLGGSETDTGYGVAVDGDGSVYVSGYSIASWQGSSSPVRAYTEGYDAYAAKLASGGALTWNTFLGGTGTDQGNAVAVDSDGNVYVTGYSSATWGSPARGYSAGEDAFAVRLSPGGALAWSTFLGTTGADRGYAISTDGNNNAHVAGYSASTWGSPIRAHSAGDDAFVTGVPNTPVYADPAAVCGGSKPCYSSLQSAINSVLTAGEVRYYGGEYDESVSLGESATLNFAGSTDATIDGALAISAGMFNAPGSNTLSLTGDFTLSGGTFNHSDGTFIFAGSGVQNLNAAVATTFHDLTVAGGVVLVETVETDNVTVDGTLTNDGTVRKLRTIPGAGSFAFGLASGPINGANLTIDVTTDNFASLQVDRVDDDPPNATAGIQTGCYWIITADGSGTADLTLPVTFTPDVDDKVCRYSGSGQTWDCAMDAYTSNTITRDGVTTFSTWAAGNDVTPTVLGLHPLGAHPPAEWTGPIALPAVLVLMGIAGAVAARVRCRRGAAGTAGQRRA